MKFVSIHSNIDQGQRDNRSGRRPPIQLLCALIWIIVTPAFAQMNLDRFFPPVVQRGTESILTAEGKFTNWPPQVFCDRKDVEVTVGKDSGKLSIRVADDAAAGVAWIRLYDEKSASGFVPVVIASAKVTEEKEPNDKRADANTLSLPTVVAGRLAKGGDSDAYRVSLKAGQQFVASVTARQVLKSPMDAVLQLTDTRGNVLIQSDDVRGLDPQIVFTADSDRECLVRIFAFPETPNSTVGFGGSAAFVYTLDVTTGPYLDHVATANGTEAGNADEIVIPYGYNLDGQAAMKRADATDMAPPVASLENALGWSWISEQFPGVKRILPDDEFDGELPIVVTGHLAKQKEIHRFTFVANKGTKYRAEVRSKADGFLLDSKLVVADSKTGKVIASNDDASRGRFDAAVEFTAKEKGELEVRLSDMLDGFGPRHFFQLSIRKVEPGFRLTVGAEHFTLSPGKPLEIPVAVSRDGGFNSKIRVSVQGLPVGVTAEPMISEPKGGTAKSVKLKLIAEKGPGGHGAIQVVGTPLDSDDKPMGDTNNATHQLRPSVSLSEFWLTIPPDATDKTSTDKAKP